MSQGTLLFPRMPKSSLAIPQEEHVHQVLKFQNQSCCFSSFRTKVCVDLFSVVPVSITKHYFFQMRQTVITEYFPVNRPGVWRHNGKLYGYPSCGIEHFCKTLSKTELQYEAICYLNYDGLTGYVPCPKCTSKIWKLEGYC